MFVAIRNYAAELRRNLTVSSLAEPARVHGAGGVSVHVVAGALLILAGAFSNAQAQQSRESGHTPDPYEIQLRFRKFTPKAGVPTGLEASTAKIIEKAPPSSKRAHVLLQLKSPPTPEDRQRLALRGIVLLEPFNNLTWYASVTTSGVGALVQDDGVRWSELIKPEDKLSHLVRGTPLSHQMREQDRVAYSVVFHKDVSAEEILAWAQQADVRLEDFDAAVYPVLRFVVVNVPEDAVTELAAADIVAWIEPSPLPKKDHNLRRAQPLSRVDVVQAAPYNLDGDGITVGLWDGGIVADEHPDLKPRVIVQPGQGTTVGAHAMHVAGIIGGSGVNVKRAKGMAPKVTIHSWDSDNDAKEMAKAAMSGQIQISSHSYGKRIGWDAGKFNDNQEYFGLYTAQSQAFDNIVFLHKLIVVKSAGNDRDDWPPEPSSRQPFADCFQGNLGYPSTCIGPVGAAKNIITVGAVDGTDRILDGISPMRIAPFSSFGPTTDGRIKPDLMAQGVNMASLSPKFDEYAVMGGTSMAAPVVSGIAALVLQDAKARNVHMSPAGMKALLVQTARDVTGNMIAHRRRTHPGPDYATGWGIVDAKGAIDLLRQSGVVHGIARRDAPWKKTFSVPANMAELRVTLAWDDPPPGASMDREKALVNDLDLYLIAPDQQTKHGPWILDPRKPTHAAELEVGKDLTRKDDVNNVEQVYVKKPATGTWTVVVSAAGLLPGLDQQFAVAGPLQ